MFPLKTGKGNLFRLFLVELAVTGVFTGVEDPSVLSFRESSKLSQNCLAFNIEDAILVLLAFHTVSVSVLMATARAGSFDPLKAYFDQKP